MNEDQIKTLRAIFREELSISEEELVDSTAYNELEAWDSLTHLKIVSRIEEAFSIELEVDDIIGMENFGKAKAIVGRYIVSPS
ncbi:MAG: acyl carrier protein [Methanomassiliicoccus sp.]|nr:acyl carrier protein [Methanomassiliicoccus sp.]